MKNQRSADSRFMRECLALAAPLRGITFPNPLVGCVIVKDDLIVGRGVHRGVGTPHAEVVALRDAGSKARGATLYANLEPCCHYGTTPPCTEAIIKAGIARVVFAIKDPNPLVKCGNSEQLLRKARITVTKGIESMAARQTNEKFLTYHETKKPFVALKLAASLDGRIATASGESKWITGERARAFVQLLRSESDAIGVGVNTIIKDDPRLIINGRLPRQRVQPLRVIFDSKLRIPLRSTVLRMRRKGSTLVLTTAQASSAQVHQVEHHGAEVHVCPADRSGRIDMRYAIKYLATRQITSLLLEGGGDLAAAAINAGVVDKLYYFIAPIIIGGRHAIPAVGGEGVQKLSKAIPLTNMSIRNIGQDILMEGYFSTKW